MIALVRTEFTKAAKRTRTLIIGLILVGLPTHRDRDPLGESPDRDNGEGLFRLVHQSGLLVPAAVLSVMSGFLLVVIAGMFAGDSVAGDSAWATFVTCSCGRYLAVGSSSRRPSLRA